MQQILIIEDDRALNQGLCKALKTDNSSIQVSSGLYAFETDRQIVSCENLKDAKEQMLCGMPSLILLDINLPDGSGLDFLQSVKMECPECPVILLTANDTDGDIVNGLELGADDYIVKPFEMLEVMVRLEKVLERNGTVQEQIQIGDVIIDTASRTVTKMGMEIYLKPMEYNCLMVFAKNPNKALTRNQILQELWNEEFCGETRTVDAHVGRIRKKLGWQDKIKTIPRIGYRLEVDL